MAEDRPELTNQDTLVADSKAVQKAQIKLEEAQNRGDSEAAGVHKSSIMAAFEKLGHDAVAMFHKSEFPPAMPIINTPPNPELTPQPTVAPVLPPTPTQQKAPAPAPKVTIAA